MGHPAYDKPYIMIKKYLDNITVSSDEEKVRISSPIRESTKDSRTSTSLSSNHIGCRSEICSPYTFKTLDLYKVCVFDAARRKADSGHKNE